MTTFQLVFLTKEARMGTKKVTKTGLGFRDGFKAALGFYSAQALITLVALTAIVTVILIVSKLS